MRKLPDAIMNDPCWANRSRIRKSDAARAAMAQRDYQRLNRMLVLSGAIAALAGGLIL